VEILDIMARKKIKIQAYYQEFMAQGYPPYIAHGKAETKWDEEEQKEVQASINACKDGIIKKATQWLFDFSKSIGVKKG
jgi:hypothetical protein